jgi:leucyl aminopeptidase
LQAAGDAVGERCWPLPLWDEYVEHTESEVADLCNVGGMGSSDCINAALFLKRFVGETPWVHLDIAGQAWVDEAKPYIPKGPTGMGIRLLVEALERGL